MVTRRAITAEEANTSQNRGDFEFQVGQAIANGAEYLEIDPAMFEYVKPHGRMGNAAYFIYKNIKVCPTGWADKIEDNLATPYIEQQNPGMGTIRATPKRVKVLSSDGIQVLEVHK